MGMEPMENRQATPSVCSQGLVKSRKVTDSRPM